MPGRRPSGVRPVYAACPISPISPISPASSGGRGAVGKVFSRLNPFSVFLPLWAGRGCPGGDARTTFPYFGSRKHPVLPGRVQRRRPVRVLPRRRTAEGGLPFPPPRVQCRFAFGGLMRNISSKEEAVFSPGRVQRRRPVRVLPRRRTAEGACRYRRPVCSAGLPSGRSDAEYILERRSCFSPGRVQRRRPVRVLPRRERLRGAVSAAPCAMQVCLRGGPMRNISSEEEAVFRRAGRRAEVCPIVSKKERRRPVRAVFSCRFLLRTQPAEHGPGGRLPPPEAAAARPEERRSENRRMLEECRFWRLRVLSGRAVQRPAIRKTSDVRRGVGCGGEGSIAGRKARKRRNSLYRPVGTDGRASQLENRRPPILLRESAGEAPVRWW
ncbi:hypothetical protein BN3659_00231 [Alistipes sp. CHKCI003]|nr:hypothetical protein BN3659_00231 [Alistipes sp. CHKCI003]